jgi:NitT/TauT family transport system substrate-binding protein
VSALRRAFYEIREKGKLDDAVAATMKNRPNQKLDPASLKAQWVSLEPYMSSEGTKGKPYGWQARSDWELTLSTMQKAGLIGAGYSVEAFYTNAFVPDSN